VPLPDHDSDMELEDDEDDAPEETDDIALLDTTTTMMAAAVSAAPSSITPPQPRTPLQSAAPLAPTSTATVAAGASTGKQPLRPLGTSKGAELQRRSSRTSLCSSSSLSLVRSASQRCAQPSQAASIAPLTLTAAVAAEIKSAIEKENSLRSSSIDEFECEAGDTTFLDGLTMNGELRNTIEFTRTMTSCTSPDLTMHSREALHDVLEMFSSALDEKTRDLTTDFDNEPEDSTAANLQLLLGTPMVTPGAASVAIFADGAHDMGENLLPLATPSLFQPTPLLTRPQPQPTPMTQSRPMVFSDSENAPQPTPLLTRPAMQPRPTPMTQSRPMVFSDSENAVQPTPLLTRPQPQPTPMTQSRPMVFSDSENAVQPTPLLTRPAMQPQPTPMSQSRPMVFSDSENAVQPTPLLTRPAMQPQPTPMSQSRPMVFSDSENAVQPTPLLTRPAMQPRPTPMSQSRPMVFSDSENAVQPTPLLTRPAMQPRPTPMSQSRSMVFQDEPVQQVVPRLSIFCDDDSQAAAVPQAPEFDQENSNHVPFAAARSFATPSVAASVLRAKPLTQNQALEQQQPVVMPFQGFADASSNPLALLQAEPYPPWYASS